MAKICILGTGLAGAFAFQACKDAGIKADVYSKTEIGSAPPGAVWFHWLPSSIQAKPIKVVYTSIGFKEEYISKQWGTYRAGQTSSFPRTTRIESGFEIAPNLPKLWEGAEITLVDSFSDVEVGKLAKQYDLVVQTFPTDFSVRALGKYRVRIPILTTPISVKFEHIHLHYTKLGDVSDAQIITVYNGVDIDKWVRRTYMQDSVHTEFPSHFKTDNWAVFPDEKVGFYMDLHPDTPPYFNQIAPKIILVGRFATWDRKYLSHQAYLDVYTKLKNLTTSV